MRRAITLKWQIVVPILLMAGVVLAGLFAITSRAEADTGPIFNPANGHSYEAISVSGGINWDDAKAAAEALGGHLATLTSAAENQFIVDNFSEAFGGPTEAFYWLGAEQPDLGSPAADGWEWVTGEPFSFTNWSTSDGGQPSDGGGAEDALQIWHSPLGAWNDQFRVSLINGYLVEYPNDCGTVSTSSGIELIAAPPSVLHGALASNSKIRFFFEQDITLPSDVDVDITASGTYFPFTSLTPGTIPAGTDVKSCFLHLDRFSNGGISGSVTFGPDLEVVGIIARTINLNDSDTDPASPGGCSVCPVLLTAPAVADRLLRGDLLVPSGTPSRCLRTAGPSP